MTAGRESRRETWAVIPAFQAASTIENVLTALGRLIPVDRTIVVDDGSTDGTGDIARRAGVRVARHSTNLGKGAALRTGIKIALTHGAEVIATLDADGQHDVESLPRLVAALNGADVVVGARMRDPSVMPLHRRFTNRASSAAVSHIVGATVADAQCGYRAFTRPVAAAAQPRGDGYEFETEFLVLSARAGFRISSVSVPTRYGAPSHFRLVRDGARVIRTIWALRRI